MTLTIRKRGTFVEVVEISGDLAGLRALQDVITSALVGAVLHPDEHSYTVHAAPEGLGVTLAIKVAG